jgi:hypothetical protein
MIRVVLPQHLRTLAHTGSEVSVEVAGQATQRTVLDALEAQYPMLRGTIRDHDTQQRRAFLRFFACEQDLSLESPDAPLPDAVASGAEPFLIIGAIAGGVDPPPHIFLFESSISAAYAGSPAQNIGEA